MVEGFTELNKVYEAEFQNKRNVHSRPISQIEWFQSSANEGNKWNAAASSKQNL